MPITHVTIKAAGQTLAAVADWNADHIGTTTPENHGNEAHTSVFITGAEVPANETDPVYSAWILGPPNVSEFTNDAGYLAAEADPIFTAWDKDHADLTNVTSDQHHAQSHTLASHSTKAHTELTNVTSDQHHAKSHAHDGIDGSGTVAHSDTTGKTANDHHAQSHNIASHNDTTATGAELETLTDNSMANTLHRHSELSASDGTPDRALVVDADGNVGIGTDSPASQLSIESETAGASVMQVLTDDDGTDIIKLGKDANDHSYLTLLDGVGSIRNHFSSFGNSWLDGGDVGIGTSIPTKLLEVDGDAGYVDATDMGVTDADFASKKYVDDIADTFTVLDEYDTGWINRSDWTNVHMGSVILTYDNLTGTFEVGETVTGGTTGDTGVVTALVGSTLALEQVTSGGIFVNNEQITGGTSGATADVNEVSGSAKNKDTDMLHNLNAPLSDLDIHILVSTDGTDNNSFELDQVVTWNASTVRYYGQQIYGRDNNSIHIQTGAHGAMYILSTGVLAAITTNDWYYKIVVRKLTSGTTSPLISRSGTDTSVSNVGDNFLVGGNTVIDHTAPIANAVRVTGEYMFTEDNYLDYDAEITDGMTSATVTFSELPANTVAILVYMNVNDSALNPFFQWKMSSGGTKIFLITVQHADAGTQNWIRGTFWLPTGGNSIWVQSVNANVAMEFKILGYKVGE